MSSWYTWVFSGVGCTAVAAVFGFLLKKRLARPKSDFSPAKISARIGSPVNAGVSGPIADSQVAVGSNISQFFEVHHHHQDKQGPNALITTLPTPSQIHKEVRSALPFDRRNAAQKYVGLKVLWEVTFATVTHNGKDQETEGETGGRESWDIYCAYYDEELTRGSHTGVGFKLYEVSPEIKVLTVGSTLWVQGTIRWVWDLGSIGLEDDPLILRIERK